MFAWSALRVVLHKGRGRVTDKARGVAECFIRHETTARVQ